MQVHYHHRYHLRGFGYISNEPFPCGWLIHPTVQLLVIAELLGIHCFRTVTSQSVVDRRKIISATCFFAFDQSLTLVQPSRLLRMTNSECCGG